MLSHNKPELRIKDLHLDLKDSGSAYEMFEMLGSLYIDQNNIRRFEKLLVAVQEIHGSPCITYHLVDLVNHLTNLKLLQPTQEWLNLTYRKRIVVKRKNYQSKNKF